MVAAFLVCGLTPPCGVLFNVQFTSEFAGRAEAAATAGTTETEGTPADRATAARRAQFGLLAERICSEALYSADVSGAGQAVDLAIEDQGVFRTQVASPFTRDMFVHWKRYTALVLAVVRAPQENAIATEGALAKVGKEILSRCKEAATSPAELVMKPEEVTAVLRTILPNGLPLIMTQSMLEQVCKGVDSHLLSA
eukprot:m.457234 g.457234  ORF g.457234 m.457234 type:complete len:196 (-) comp21216_c0_seq1:68-655(-)